MLSSKPTAWGDSQAARWNPKLRQETVKLGTIAAGWREVDLPPGRLATQMPTPLQNSSIGISKLKATSQRR